MLPEQEAAADLKTRIIDHAFSLIRTSGFSHVSVEEISSGLGISKKTFYKYFDSKEDLLHQIVNRLVGETELLLHSIVDRDEPFVAKLHALTTAISQQFRKFGTFLIRDVQVHSPQSWKYVEEFRRKKILTVWGGIIEQGKREGYIRTEINSRLLLLSLLGVIESVVNPSTLSNESFSADEALQGIIIMLFRGVLTEDAVSQLEYLNLTQQP